MKDQTTKFRVYANLNDGRGLVLASKKRFTSRETADSEVRRLLNGKIKASRAYTIPTRPGDPSYELSYAAGISANA